MSQDSSILRQADEVEALSAIYGDEWCVIDSDSKIYCILVSDNTETPNWKLSLQVHMPPDYPLMAPPVYQINGTWLRGEERVILENKLSQVYCDNMGEDLIFLWVEAVREFLQAKADKDMLLHGSISTTGRFVVKSAETEDDDNDDEFDPSILGDLSYFQMEQLHVSSQSVQCPEIFHGETLTDRRSTFQAHLAQVTDKAQIQVVLNTLLQNKKIANATHNMFAYRIVSESGLVYQGCDDDGETHAGSRMLHLLQIMNAENVIVVVSRWYGGILLGSDRFKHINNCTRMILEANGFHREKDDKKGPKSAKKVR